MTSNGLVGDESKGLLLLVCLAILYLFLEIKNDDKNDQESKQNMEGLELGISLGVVVD